MSTSRRRRVARDTILENWDFGHDPPDPLIPDRYEAGGGGGPGATPLHEVSVACGLSISHFSRAFHKSTGLAPHAWLLKARIDRAMTMLRRREGSISEIALACGFADHSHFTRVFRRRVGMGPAEWRRLSVT